MTNRECADNYKVRHVVNKMRILRKLKLFDFSVGFVRYTQASQTGTPTGPGVAVTKGVSASALEETHHIYPWKS